MARPRTTEPEADPRIAQIIDDQAAAAQEAESHGARIQKIEEQLEKVAQVLAANLGVSLD